MACHNYRVYRGDWICPWCIHLNRQVDPVCYRSVCRSHQESSVQEAVLEWGRHVTLVDDDTLHRHFTQFQTNLSSFMRTRAEEQETTPAGAAAAYHRAWEEKTAAANAAVAVAEAAGVTAREAQEAADRHAQAQAAAQAAGAALEVAAAAAVPAPAMPFQPKEQLWKPGDWECPVAWCKNHNFASRQVCNRCGEPKPPQ